MDRINVVTRQEEDLTNHLVQIFCSVFYTGVSAMTSLIFDVIVESMNH